MVRYGIINAEGYCRMCFKSNSAIEEVAKICAKDSEWVVEMPEGIDRKLYKYIDGEWKLN